MILPLFGFANAGVALSGMTMNDLLSPVPVGVALGLFLGKQAGIGLSLLAVSLAWRNDQRKVPGYRFMVSRYCGIGFTMSLFIGNLAFTGSLCSLMRSRWGFWQGPYWPLWPVF
jgi:NhaA family Na+:H+ antiporter